MSAKNELKKEIEVRDLRLKLVPKDVIDHIYDVQNDLKKEHGRNVSLERAVNKIVREHKRAKA